jgi:predicted PurR-regulated permease PerM
MRSMAAPAPEPGERRARRAQVLEVDLTSLGYVVLALLVTSGVIAVFRDAPSAITQVAVGSLLAFALDPLVVRTRRSFHWSRSVAVTFVAACLVAAFAIIAVLLAPPAISQAGELTSELPQTVERTYGWPVIGERLEEADAAGQVERFLDELPGRVDDDTLSVIAAAAIGGVQTLALVLLTAVAVMVDGEALVARARRLIAPDRRERADEIGRIVYRTVGNYFAGSLLVAVLNGLFILTAGLALGVPLTPLAAIWSTLTNLIPQIGGLLGGSFFVILAITEGPVTGAAALGLFLAYQQIENNVVQPAVVGKAVNLSPPTTMLAALIGGAAAGVPGALAATPLLGTVKAIYLELRSGPPAPELSAASRPLGSSSRRTRRRRRSARAR